MRVRHENAFIILSFAFYGGCAAAFAFSPWPATRYVRAAVIAAIAVAYEIILRFTVGKRK